jgi:hypothetical protein
LQEAAQGWPLTNPWHLAAPPDNERSLLIEEGLFGVEERHIRLRGGSIRQRGCSANASGRLATIDDGIISYRWATNSR